MRTSLRWAVLLIGLGLGLVPSIAAAQLSDSFSGMYRGVDSRTGAEFLFRLEFPAALLGGRPILVGTSFGPGGTYQVFGGLVERGGLNIPFGYLCPAKNPDAAYRVLRRPIPLLTAEFSQDLPAEASLLDHSQCCQLDFFTVPVDPPGHLTYSCGGASSSSGTLYKLRP